MKTIVLTATLMLATAAANATNQTPDLLILDSKTYTISWPESPFVLEPYIKKHDLKLRGDWSTANYNGHHAIWMVRAEKLYLVGFDSEMPNHQMPGVKDLPGAKGGELFAEWFTGSLTLDYGSFPYTKGKIGRRRKVEFKNGVMIRPQKTPAGDRGRQR